MSELQELCRTLESVNRDADRLAAELTHRAQHLMQAAGRAAGAADSSSRRECAQVAQTLQAAARSAHQAARLLHQVAVSGRGFVTRHAGTGTGGARIGSAGAANPRPGTATAQSIFDEQSFAFDKGPGRFFLAPDDALRDLADTMPRPTDGSYLAVIHGAADVVGVGDTDLSATELASLIRSDPGYQEGRPVTLFACSTGQDPNGFAQQLADRLGVPVTAPTSLVWLPPDTRGSIVVTPQDPITGGPALDPNGRGYGGWRRFEPAAA